MYDSNAKFQPATHISTKGSISTKTVEISERFDVNWLKDVKQIEILSYDRMMERQKEVHKLNILQLLISEVVCLFTLPIYDFGQQKNYPLPI